MIIEISVSILCITISALAVFLIFSIHSSKKSLKQIQKDISSLSENGLELSRNLNELTEDLKQKAESLDFIFRFIDGFNHKRPAKSTHLISKLPKKTEQIAEIIDLVQTSVDLYQRIKRDFSKYIKRK